MIESKSFLEKKKSNKPKYPYLGYSDNDFIVLFTSQDTGMLIGFIDDDEETNIGEYSEGWIEKDFTEFKGEITLKNK
jgi:hypothetical protein